MTEILIKRLSKKVNLYKNGTDNSSVIYTTEIVKKYATIYQWL